MISGSERFGCEEAPKVILFDDFMTLLTRRPLSLRHSRTCSPLIKISPLAGPFDIYKRMILSSGILISELHCNGFVILIRGLYLMIPSKQAISIRISGKFSNLDFL